MAKKVKLTEEEILRRKRDIRKGIASEEHLSIDEKKERKRDERTERSDEQQKRMLELREEIEKRQEERMKEEEEKRRKIEEKRLEVQQKKREKIEQRLATKYPSEKKSHKLFWIVLILIIIGAVYIYFRFLS